MSGRSYLVKPFGTGFKVDAFALRNALMNIERRPVSYEVIRDLRDVASEIESEAARLRDESDGFAEVGEREAEFLEGAVAELGKLGIIHDPSRVLGVLARALGPLLGVTDRHDDRPLDGVREAGRL